MNALRGSTFRATRTPGGDYWHSNHELKLKARAKYIATRLVPLWKGDKGSGPVVKPAEAHEAVAAGTGQRESPSDSDFNNGSSSSVSSSVIERRTAAIEEKEEE